MANITTTIANTAGFQPQVWAQRALDILRSNIVLAPLVTKDNDWEPGYKGKQLNIPYPGTFTATDKSADTAATVQTPSGGTTVNVTLGSHKNVDFLVEDVARAQASEELLDRYIKPAIIALGNAVEDDIFTTAITFSNNVGTYGTDLTGSSIRSARSSLNGLLAPLAPRYLVVASKDEISILGDSTLASFFAFARPDAVAQGSLGMVYGFDVRMSQRVPTVAGTPTQTKCVAFHPEGLMLATRPFMPPPENSGVAAATVQDPGTGLFLRVLYQYDISYRAVRVGFDILYGVKLLRNELGLLVKS